MDIDRKAARAEYMRMLATDYLFFVRELWKDRGLDKKAPIGDLEDEMLTFVSAGPRMRGILGARGLGKTTLLVAPLVVYRLFRDPDRKVMIVSKSAGSAKETIGLCRAWINDVWFLQHLKPQKDQPDNTNEFSVGTAKRGISKQPSVKAIGNDGQLEGNRAHTFLADDAETKGNTRTMEAREELMRTVGNEATNIVYAVDDAIDPNEIIAIGTYKCEDSWYKRLHARGYAFRTYPIAYPQEGDQFLGLSPILQKRLQDGTAKYTVDGNYDQNPALPHFFKSATIKERMGAGLLDFGMENMLLVNPGKQSGPPLRLSSLIVMPIDRNVGPIRVKPNGACIGDIACEGLVGDALYGPESTDSIRERFQTTLAVIDIAGEGNDLMGVAIVSYLNGLFFLKYCKGWPGGASVETMSQLAVLFRSHGVKEAWVETNIDIFNTFAPALAVECRKLHLSPGVNRDYPEGWACAVDGFHATGQKEVRICQMLQPVFGNNRMIVDPSVLRPDITLEAHQTFQYQVSRIRPIKKWLREDGPIDALASAIKKLQEGTFGISRDPEKGSERAQLREINAFHKRMNRLHGLEGPETSPPRIYGRA